MTKSMCGQLLAERGHALDVGLARAAALARVGVADVEHVAAGAAVAVVGVEHERRGVAAARLDRPVARRGGDGIVNQSRGNPHARAVDLGAGPGEESRRPARTAPRCPCRRAPPGSLRARACRLRRPRSSERASFMPPPPSLSCYGRASAAVVSAGWGARWTDCGGGSVGGREQERPRAARPGHAPHVKAGRPAQPPQDLSVPEGEVDVADESAGWSRRRLYHRRRAREPLDEGQPGDGVGRWRARVRAAGSPAA